MFRMLVDEWNKDLPDSARMISSGRGIRCRICMQSDTPEHLISPCRCIGTVKYVHEGCLKAWILAQGSLANTQCELCKSSYEMKFYLGRRCHPAGFLNLNEPMAILGLFIAVVLPLLVYLSFRLFGAAMLKEGRQQVCVFIIFGMLCFLGLALVSTLTVAWSKLCLPKCVKHWQIFSQESDSLEPSQLDATDCEMSHVLQRPYDEQNLSEEKEVSWMTQRVFAQRDSNLLKVDPLAAPQSRNNKYMVLTE